jgi:hypothetical protein
MPSSRSSNPALIIEYIPGTCYYRLLSRLYLHSSILLVHTQLALTLFSTIGIGSGPYYIHLLSVT